jgi:hypothetical protein
MSRVNLHEIEACGGGTMGSRDEVGDDFVHTCAIESGGDWVGFVEADGGGSDRLPAAFRSGNGAGYFPWNGHAGLAPGVRELGAGVGTVLVKEGSDALEFGNVLVFPDAEVSRRDAALRAHGVGLCDDEAGTTYGAAAEVDQVPVVGKAIDAGVFAHGRHGDAVWQSEAAELKRREEVVYGVGHTGLDVARKIWTDGFNTLTALVWDSKELQTFLMVFLWWICGEMRGEPGEKMAVILDAERYDRSLFFLERFLSDGT